MNAYTISVINTKTNSGLETIEFEAAHEAAAIEELNSYKTPQDDGKSGNYELELFEGERFISSIKLNQYV